MEVIAAGFAAAWLTRARSDALVANVSKALRQQSPLIIAAGSALIIAI